MYPHFMWIDVQTLFFDKNTNILHRKPNLNTLRVVFLNVISYYIDYTFLHFFFLHIYYILKNHWQEIYHLKLLLVANRLIRWFSIDDYLCPIYIESLIIMVDVKNYISNFTFTGKCYNFSEEFTRIFYDISSPSILLLLFFYKNG